MAYFGAAFADPAIPAAESALKLRLRRALPSAQVRLVYLDFGELKK
jgi:hypothetical protein